MLAWLAWSVPVSISSPNSAPHVVENPIQPIETADVEHKTSLTVLCVASRGVNGASVAAILHLLASQVCMETHLFGVHVPYSYLQPLSTSHSAH